MTRQNPSGGQALRVRVAIPHLAALLLVSLVIYAPWAPAPFPMLDYSEFLQPLRRSASFGEGLANLTEYYRSHGRSSYLAYLQLAANWSIFGERPTGWSLMVFAYMFAALVTAWLLLVRIGNSPVAATLASALLITATPAMPGWLRPSGEPLALLFFCVALIVALDYQQSSRWRGRAVMILLALLGIGLAKDLLAPLAIAPVVLACCWADGLHLPKASRRNLVLLAGAALVALCLAYSVGSALLDRAPDAYTRAYRANNISLGGFISVFWMMLLPYTSSFNTAQVLGNVAFALAVLVGWRLNVRPDPAHNKLREASAWLGLLLVGSLLYTPVSWYTPLYGLPFFLGSVALLSRALSRAALARPTPRRAVHVLVAIVLVVGLGTAFNRASRERAERRLNGQLATALRRFDVDSIMMALPVVNAWAWAQQSAVLRRYAIDRGDLAPNAPGTRDVECGAMQPDAASAVRILVINFPDQCGALTNAADEVTQRYTVLTPLPSTRQLRAELIVSGPASSGAARPQ